MLKTIIVAIIAGLPLMFGAGEASAGVGRSMAVNGVLCPAGTCGGSGGPKAKELKYCKASHCGQGKSSK